VSEAGVVGGGRGSDPGKRPVRAFLQTQQAHPPEERRLTRRRIAKRWSKGDVSRAVRDRLIGTRPNLDEARAGIGAAAAAY
jgi:hypothetical protein